jgi:hypothetical protein
VFPTCAEKHWVIVKKSNLEKALWINLFDYNHRTFHKGLRIALEKSPGKQRFKRKWLHRLALGLTKQTLSWWFLLVVPIPLTY